MLGLLSIISALGFLVGTALAAIMHSYRLNVYANPRKLLDKAGYINGLKHIGWNCLILGSLNAFFSGMIAYFFPQVDIQLIINLILTWCLLALAVIDIEYLVLPNNLIFPLWLLGGINSLFNGSIDPIVALLGSIAAYGSLSLLAAIYARISGQIGLGQGDVKLFGMLGIWLGWPVLISVLLVASLSGILFIVIRLLFKKQTYDTPIPFGPFLAGAGWLALMGRLSPIA